MEEAKRRIAEWNGENYYLDLSHLHLTELPSIPLTLKLKVLYCHDNQLTGLPSLPPSLIKIYCSNNNLKSLPSLPSSLKLLYCYNNKIISLPSIPSSLRYLYCSYNKLTSLPPLPSSLINLYCWNNSLKSLPPLPPSLENLHCSDNQITSIPSLPPSLEEFYCYNNQLEVNIQDNETPQDYWNRLEEIQSKKRIINRTKELKEEIMKTFWHPTNVQKLLDMYGIDFEDYV